ncbi:Helitron helicase [Phytophthora megakarya]|uniref:Helitron helicase n=1 Tax=Phytophthora megakarya TaxID=4795 RepID=A0A225W2K1_9STRA|nr:Helitron helicase [Phytophthora megakarya]
MRVQTSRNTQTAAEVGTSAEYLLQVGDGRHFISPALGPDFIKVPEDTLLDSNIEEQVWHRLLHLVEIVYTDLNSGNHPDDYFADRIILTPKNTDVLAISNLMPEKVHGEMHEFTSVDSVDGDDELQRQEHGDLYPPEFLSTVSLSGMYPHKLNLKVGTPVILIRKMSTKEGLCNGTRLRIVQLRPNCMEAAIMGGAFAGKRVIIPRIALVSKNSGFPFELRRKPFPVQVAFVMTINKWQGQSIHRLGLYLPEPVFSHGQFYVAMSRVTSRNNIVILVDEPPTTSEGVHTKKNVYREIVAVDEAVV